MLRTGTLDSRTCIFPVVSKKKNPNTNPQIRVESTLACLRYVRSSKTFRLGHFEYTNKHTTLGASQVRRMMMLLNELRCAATPVRLVMTAAIHLYISPSNPCQGRTCCCCLPRNRQRMVELVAPPPPIGKQGDAALVHHRPAQRSPLNQRGKILDRL